MEKIPIYVSDRSLDPQDKEEATLGLLGSDDSGPKGLRLIDAEKLKTSAQSLTKQLSTVFADLEAVGDFKLREVTVTIEVSAEGSLILVGKAGITGGIALKFAP